MWTAGLLRIGASAIMAAVLCCGPAAAGGVPKIVVASLGAAPHLAEPTEIATPSVRTTTTTDRSLARPEETGRWDAERCRRWRVVADRLGDTFAGHTLRKTVVHRHCGLFEEPASERWAWPWSEFEQQRTAPLKLHKNFGAWAIYCATAGDHKRCALIHEGVTSTLASDRADKGQLSTHFVIDRVAGREMLLWRLIVPIAGSAHTGVAVAGLAIPTDRLPAIRNTADSQAKLPASGWTAKFHLADGEHKESFLACRAVGCLMEARGEVAGAVATNLAEGKAITLGITGHGQPTRMVTVPARHFDSALAELIRLRRAEHKP